MSVPLFCRCAVSPLKFVRNFVTPGSVHKQFRWIRAGVPLLAGFASKQAFCRRIAVNRTTSSNKSASIWSCFRRSSRQIPFRNIEIILKYVESVHQVKQMCKQKRYASYGKYNIILEFRYLDQTLSILGGGPVL